MKRQTVLRYLVKSLQPNDIVLFQGKQLCREAFKYHREGNLYLDNSNALALGIGLANGTDKKVFVVIDDNFVLKNMDICLQAAASKCTNLFVLLIVSGCYYEIKNMPNIFSGISNSAGLFFSMGFVVHDYTKRFESGDYLEIKKIWSRARGPLMGIAYVDLGANKKAPYVELDFNKYFKEFTAFVQNKDFGSSVFIPPVSLDAGMVTVEGS